MGGVGGNAAGTDPIANQVTCRQRDVTKGARGDPLASIILRPLTSGRCAGRLLHRRITGESRLSPLLLLRQVLGTLVEFRLHEAPVMRVLFFFRGVSLCGGTLLGASVRLPAMTARWGHIPLPFDGDGNRQGISRRFDDHAAFSDAPRMVARRGGGIGRVLVEGLLRLLAALTRLDRVG